MACWATATAVPIRSTPARRVAVVEPPASRAAVAVAQQAIAEFRGQYGFDPLYAVAVNLRRADGFAHVLSASSIPAAGSGIFLPLEGLKGETVAAGTKSLACAIDPYLGIVAGEPDIVTDASKDKLDDQLEHKAGAC